MTRATGRSLATILMRPSTYECATVLDGSYCIRWTEDAAGRFKQYLVDSTDRGNPH